MSNNSSTQKANYYHNSINIPVLSKQSLLRPALFTRNKPRRRISKKKSAHTDIETTVYETNTNDVYCLSGSKIKFRLNEITNINKRRRCGGQPGTAAMPIPIGNRCVICTHRISIIHYGCSGDLDFNDICNTSSVIRPGIGKHAVLFYAFNAVFEVVGRSQRSPAVPLPKWDASYIYNLRPVSTHTHTAGTFNSRRFCRWILRGTQFPLVDPIDAANVLRRSLQTS